MYRLLLRDQRAPSCLTDVIGRRDEKSEGELLAAGLTEKGVDVRLCDRVPAVIGLGLHRPNRASGCRRHKVDAGINTPSSGPLLPQPDVGELTRVDRVILKQPLTDSLELFAADVFLGAEPCE